MFPFKASIVAAIAINTLAYFQHKTLKGSKMNALFFSNFQSLKIIGCPSPSTRISAWTLALICWLVLQPGIFPSGAIEVEKPLFTLRNIGKYTYPRYRNGYNICNSRVQWLCRDLLH